MSRKSIRLDEYDYFAPGAYFFSICTQGRRECLATIVDGEAVLSKEGEIVLRTWESLPEHYSNILMDEFGVMPDHAHGVVFIVEDRGLARPVGAGLLDLNKLSPPISRPAPTSLFSGHGGQANPNREAVGAGLETAENLSLHDRRPALTAVNRRQASLFEIIRALKSFSARNINVMRGKNHPIWQRGYYDHIIRNEIELNAIREYIANNPLQWSLDNENHISSDLDFHKSLQTDQ